MHVAEVINDRFSRWGSFLRSKNATPLLALGLTAGTHELIVTTCEGGPDALTEEMLLAALTLLRREPGA